MILLIFHNVISDIGRTNLSSGVLSSGNNESHDGVFARAFIIGIRECRRYVFGTHTYKLLSAVK